MPEKPQHEGIKPKDETTHDPKDPAEIERLREELVARNVRLLGEFDGDDPDEEIDCLAPRRACGSLGPPRRVKHK